MNLYLKAARGESIEDVSDLDKEIALFKGSFEKTYVAKSDKIVESTFINVLFPIYKIANTKFSQLNELFKDKRHNLSAVFLGDKYFHRIEEDFFAEGNKNLDLLFPYKANGITNKHLDSLKYSYGWFGFNRSDNHTYFRTELIISFKDFQYDIKLNEEKLLLKNYDDNVTEFEMQEVVSKWLRYVLAELKKTIGNK